MLAADSITLFNYFYHENSVLFLPTYISPVAWRGSLNSKLNKLGAMPENLFRVLIWFSANAENKKYLPPNEFAKLSLIDAQTHFTLNPGYDRIFKGILPDLQLPIDILIKLHSPRFLITSVNELDKGSIHLRHWEVKGS